MGKVVLFIQGGGGGAYAADSTLAASLQRALGSDYHVVYPRMPNEDNPDYEAWKPIIDKEITHSDGPVILIAHSLGAYILLKYLTEEATPKKKLLGIFIIAAPYPGGDRNWQFEGFSLPENFGKKLPGNAQIFLYHSRDDHIVPFAHMALYAAKMPRATVRETTGSHQLNGDLSIVAEDIQHMKA